MLTCLFSYTLRSQHASSAKDPPLSTTTPVDKKLKSTPYGDIVSINALLSMRSNFLRKSSDAVRQHSN